MKILVSVMVCNVQKNYKTFFEIVLKKFSKKKLAVLLFWPLHSGDDVMDEDVWQGRKLFRQLCLMLVIVGKL
jgi:hypothetical protein